MAGCGVNTIWLNYSIDPIERGTAQLLVSDKYLREFDPSSIVARPEMVNLGVVRDLDLDSERCQVDRLQFYSS